MHASTNVITRVMKLTHPDGRIGTAFTIEVDDRQFMITARHVLPEAVARLDLHGAGTVGDIHDVVPLPNIPKNVDIAVVPFGQRLTHDFPFAPTMEGMRLGQEVFFWGYPYGMESTAPGIERTALIKRALLSAMDVRDGARILLLDGFNNPGFSGGPVVFVSQETQALHVAAVISGYHPEVLEVLDHLDREDEAEAQEKEKARSAFVQANSGIIVAYSIDHAVEAIREAYPS